MAKNERNAGRKRLFGHRKTKIIGILIPEDKEKEIRRDIKLIQEKYK
jgi:hypothetical protein